MDAFLGGLAFALVAIGAGMLAHAVWDALLPSLRALQARLAAPRERRRRLRRRQVRGLDYARIAAAERELGMATAGGRLTCARCGTIGVYDGEAARCPACGRRYDDDLLSTVGFYDMARVARLGGLSMAETAEALARVAQAGISVGDILALRGRDAMLAALHVEPPTPPASLPPALPPAPPPGPSPLTLPPPWRGVRVVVMPVDDAFALPSLRSRLGAEALEEMRKYMAWEVAARGPAGGGPCVAAVARSTTATGRLGRLAGVNIQQLPAGMTPPSGRGAHVEAAYEYVLLASVLTDTRLRAALSQAAAARVANVLALAARTYPGVTLIARVASYVEEYRDAAPVPLWLEIGTGASADLFRPVNVAADGTEDETAEPPIVPLGVFFSLTHYR